MSSNFIRGRSAAHLRILAAALAITATHVYAQAPSRSAGAAIQQVAHFGHQVTGVAVTPDGRVFVNFPRWTEDTAVSVAELGRDGKLRPYPNANWNGWRNAGDLAPVVRRNSVNPETISSKEALIRVDIVKHTPNDLKSSTRVSAT